MLKIIEVKELPGGVIIETETCFLVGVGESRKNEYLMQNNFCAKGASSKMINLHKVIVNRYDEIIQQPRNVSPEVDLLETKCEEKRVKLMEAMPTYQREIIDLYDDLTNLSGLEREEDFIKGFSEGMAFMEQLSQVKEKAHTAATACTTN